MEKQVIDEFEYKGVYITVLKDTEGECFFSYIKNGSEIVLPLEEMEEFMTGSFSHTTINKVPLDIIEKSVKIKDLLFDFRDLKHRINKYKK